jgi:CheY-like chemotaxis protein
MDESTGQTELELLTILEVRPLELPTSAHGGSWPCAVCGDGHAIESGSLVLAFGPSGRMDLIVCPDCGAHAADRVRPPRTVLLAEDDDAFRTDLRGWLERDGVFEVVAETDDGNEVEAHVEVYDPELVLLDLRLPNRDGLELLEVLAERPNPPAIAVLTAFPSADAEVLAERLGSQLFLDKRTSRATGLVVQLVGV